MSVAPSTLRALGTRVAKRNYQKYLLEVRLRNVRAFGDQKITLAFPVTAVIGTNGGGKSTILGAAALAYKSVKPGDFFPKSNVGDTSMADWRIEYDILDREVANAALSKNARFVAAKWRRDNSLDRDVIVFKIQRTVPAGEQTRYKKFIGMTQRNPIITPLPVAVRRHAGHILGKDLTAFKLAKLHKTDEDYILLGYQKANDYSQFHFGAGEASIIEMVTRIEAADNEALILIEEIENGLHPVATERMVEYLIGAAERKRLQVIFTTHSEYALKKLPPEAIWACIDGEAYQGRLSIDSLRAITGGGEKERVIFVEDDFAVDWVEDILRQYDMKALAATEIHAAGGYPYLISVAEHHNKNPSISKRAIAVVDGDQPIAASGKILKLPGEIPESEVYGYISENAQSLSSLVQQRCQCPNLSQDEIVKAIKKAEIDTTDPHLIFRTLGECLGFMSEIVVRRGMISIYDERNKSSVQSLAKSLVAFVRDDN
ncbi:AAA family ATPase [Bradyrhizobium sp. STM 3843]|uniref:ATP-dependent nuclease n=1 Tax=Bradyrhizobium sp. STM 3843 TaxID=551947 RepID=UPI000561A24E|nr:AAA family ATPase [Bradyrhizobium sp. STM 3843]